MSVCAVMYLPIIIDTQAYRYSCR